MLVEEVNQIDNTTRAAMYADDLTVDGRITRLRNRWDTLCRLGPKFGYVNEGSRSKSWLIIKERVMQKPRSVFRGTNIKITAEGQHHLGTVTRSETFKQNTINKK